jgi:hypothetical protein
MEQGELRFDLTPGPTAPATARSLLSQLPDLDLAVLDRLKTIVSSLVTRSMREGGGWPMRVSIDRNSKTMGGRVSVPEGWEGLSETARDHPEQLAVLGAFTRSWGIQGRTVWFVLAI